MGRTGGDPKGGDIWDLKLEDLFSDTSSKRATDAGGTSGLWVINLVTSAEPISISSATLLHFEQFQLFQVTAWKSDRLLFRLRLGPIDSELQANAVLAEVAREYPKAEVLAASEDDIRMISAVAASGTPRPSAPKKPRTKYGLDEFIASQNEEPPPPPKSRASMLETPRPTAAATTRASPAAVDPTPPPATHAIVERRVAPPAAPPTIERRTAPPAPPPMLERRTAPSAPTVERRMPPRPASPATPPSARVTAPPPPTTPKLPPGPPSWLQSAARSVLEAEPTATHPAAHSVERAAAPATPPAARAPEPPPPPAAAAAPPASVRAEPPAHVPPPHPTRPPVSPAHKSLEETDTALPQLKLPAESVRTEASRSAPSAANGDGFVGALFDPSSDVFLELSLAPDSPRAPPHDVPSSPPVVSVAPPPPPTAPLRTPAPAPAPAPAVAAKPSIPVLDTPVASKANRRDRRAAAKAAKAEAARRAVASRSAAAPAPAKPVPPTVAPTPEPRAAAPANAAPAAAAPVPSTAAPPLRVIPAAVPPPPTVAASAPQPEPRAAARAPMPAVPTSPAAPPDAHRIAARAVSAAPAAAPPATPSPPQVAPPPASTTPVHSLPTPRPVDIPPRPALPPTSRPIPPAVTPAAMAATARRPAPSPAASPSPPRPPIARPAPPPPVASAPPAAAPAAPAPKAATPIRQFEVLGGALPDLDSTQTIRALSIPELENEAAPKLFAIELTVSSTQISPEQIPNLAIFNEYHLYMAIAQVDGRSAHALKLGFFTDDAPAQAVAGYLSSYFNGPKVARVSVAERERFASRRVRAGKDSGDSGSHAVIDIASPERAPTTSLAELAARAGRKPPKR